MPASTLTAAAALRWIEDSAAVLDGKKDYLTELDSAIGDGDHGVNMARGFQAVKAKLSSVPPNDIGALFKLVAMTLISTTGGASGPLYGTFFLKTAVTISGKAELTPSELGAAFQAGLAGVLALGKAAVGDKTMVDVLTPAIHVLTSSANGELLSAELARAVEAARKGAESTVPLVARKGRASYLGERSTGHLDPGAASSLLLFETLAKTVGD